ncbi:LysE family translocator [Roseivirga sp.]|uniref:LysE family translocator n=1 Tax=Roseivirga sp. TaxID=1964215 RepID=UPI002B274EC6|nr:LysE family transporter [Roseivirga sp.]
MHPILNGLLFGLLLCVLIGPVFFALIQNSIEKGFWSGFFMAIGVALSDAFYILITYFGISQLVESENFKMWLGGVGGVIMLGFGLFYLFKSVPKTVVMKNTNGNRDGFKQILKGFFLNGVNPFVLFFWIGIMSKVSIDFEYTSNQALAFFVALVGTVFIVDVIKSYFATKLREIVTARFMRIMNRTVGVALILFALRLLNFLLEGFGIELFA